MRAGLWVVGILAAFYCAGLTAILVLVGVMAVMDPGSVDGGLWGLAILVPFIVGSFAVARWAFRRAGRLPVSPAGQRLNDWAARHPVRMVGLCGGAMFVLWSLVAGWRAGLIEGVVLGLTVLLADRLRRRRRPAATH